MEHHYSVLREYLRIFLVLVSIANLLCIKWLKQGFASVKKLFFFSWGFQKKRNIYIYIYIGLISHKYFLTNPFVILTDSSHTLEVKVSFPIVNPISCIKLSWNSKPYICRKTLQPKIFRACLVMLLFNVAWTIVSLFKQHNMYFHNT